MTGMKITRGNFALLVSLAVHFFILSAVLQFIAPPEPAYRDVEVFMMKESREPAAQDGPAPAAPKTLKAQKTAQRDRKQQPEAVTQKLPKPAPEPQPATEREPLPVAQKSGLKMPPGSDRVGSSEKPEPAPSPAGGRQSIGSSPSPSALPHDGGKEGSGGLGGAGKDFAEDIAFGTGTGPMFLHRELPVYPMAARRTGREGWVLLRLTIDKTGRLLDVEVVEDDGEGFAKAAVEAIKKSTFTPASRNGSPIKARALLPVRFALNN